MLRSFFLTMLCGLLSDNCAAALNAARVFSDHMVIQRERTVPVWGRADANVSVLAAFAGQTAKTIADGEGNWRLEFQPMAANDKGRDMTFRSGHDVVVLHDILVGEVWFAGGQSNMAQKMSSCAKRLPEMEELVDGSDYPSLRYRKIDEQHSATPRDDLTNGKWVVCSPNSVGEFSAVAYVVARRLHLKLGVPVGVIDCSWGGTPIESYIPADAFVGHPTLTKLAALAKRGDFEAIKDLPGGTFVRSEKWLAGAIYNSRIAPVAPYAIRGAIWYQGESNSGKGEDPRDYAHKMRALIRGWRSAWQQADLPFYYVQLPQWKSYAWTYLREEQRRAMDVTNTGMAVTVDLDNGNDIHPPNKLDVGERLARWPLANVYSDSVPFSGPLFHAIRVKGSIVEVSFDHADDGLMAGQAGIGKVTEISGGTLNGFELTGADGRWHVADAKISEQKVLVSSASVTNPVAVRYACHPEASPDAPWNLYNRAGLPASPFCSDWKRMPYDAARNPR